MSMSGDQVPPGPAGNGADPTPSLLERWRGGTVPRDGGSPALEAMATDPPAALLEADQAEPSAPSSIGHVRSGRTVIAETVTTKVLHGWLQNRHQTLFPLAVNLRALDEAQRRTLAQMTAILLLADRDQADDGGAQARAARVRDWLQGAGGQADTMAALDAALADPPALSRAIDAVIAHDLSAYAYVAAVVSLDSRMGAGAHMLDYLAARLALPVTLVRSANRRFGR